MASFAAEKFNASASIAGLVSGIYIIGTVGGRLLTGNIINKVGSKKILIIGLIAFVLTTLLYFVSLNIGLLLFSRFVNGFRSEEHTSELQSRFELVCRLLLEKKHRNPTRLVRGYL